MKLPPQLKGLKVGCTLYWVEDGTTTPDYDTVVVSITNDSFSTNGWQILDRSMRRMEVHTYRYSDLHKYSSNIVTEQYLKRLKGKQIKGWVLK